MSPVSLRIVKPAFLSSVNKTHLLSVRVYTCIRYRVWLIDPDPRSAQVLFMDSYDARVFLAGVWVILEHHPEKGIGS